MTLAALRDFINENKERSKQIRRAVYEDGVFGNEWYTAFDFERDCYKAMLALNKVRNSFNINEC